MARLTQRPRVPAVAPWGETSGTRCSSATGRSTTGIDQWARALPMFEAPTRDVLELAPLLCRRMSPRPGGAHRGDRARGGSGRAARTSGHAPCPTRRRITSDRRAFVDGLDEAGLRLRLTCHRRRGSSKFRGAPQRRRCSDSMSREEATRAAVVPAIFDIPRKRPLADFRWRRSR